MNHTSFKFNSKRNSIVPNTLHTWNRYTYTGASKPGRQQRQQPTQNFREIAPLRRKKLGRKKKFILHNLFSAYLPNPKSDPTPLYIHIGTYELTQHQRVCFYRNHIVVPKFFKRFKRLLTPFLSHRIHLLLHFTEVECKKSFIQNFLRAHNSPKINFLQCLLIVFILTLSTLALCKVRK